ncbi:MULTISPECIES: LysM peptidoglycan-binding domain-containing M23 family metallopeptidase [Methylosinus]|uniref:Peptidase M23 n=1 Tax=Methylosinus trichosporium (strain ATCC 35070 / NCIMB 11131 / UNIQEM 75 / OB3b) TaxID=595536 RepID=A0A2D2CVT7_METT3|nr:MULTISPECIES: peptidoglycan DD-metalloendopeptidase family protein [Methylosinus]ATQ66833.1 peptidase M23 [Methylosinus trichosporium OB3b]OBS54294.1 peptidase M23 [Methylosinus sp. 3S-1]
MFAAGAAGLLAGCSDATRFTDPLSDPFQEQAPHVDRAPTGTISPRTYAEAAPPRGIVQSRPLPPPQQQQQPMAQAERYAPPAVPAPAPRVAGSFNHWSAEGGTPLVVSDGESAGMLATRYGVPLDALLRVNGFSRPTEVHPGSRLVIPVYRAGAASAPMEPVRAAADPRPGRREIEAASERSRTPVVEARAEKHAPAIEPRSVKPAVAEAKIEKPKLEAKIEKPKLAEVKVAKAVDSRPKPIEAKVEKPKAQPVAAKVVEKPKAQLARAEAEKAAPAKLAKPAALAEPARKAPHEAIRKAEAEPVHAKTARKEPVAAPKEMAKAEPRKVETKAREQLAKKEAPEPKRQTVAAEKVEKVEKQKVAAAPQPAPHVDKTPVASLPPVAQQQPAPQPEEKPAPAAADARPEFRWPARGRIIQGFNSGGNDGINISVPEGTQVKAAEGGVVAYAGNELKGYGNLVLIRHPNGFVSAYAHNGELEVKRGDQVKRGQNIAKSGQSGNVGTPQLHFELRKGATPVDPTSYLAGL